MCEFGDSRVPPRIWEKAVVTENDCWLWTGATGGGKSHKYAVALCDGVYQGVHRWIYGVIVRPATKGEHVHHECGTTLCINPAHLRALPIREHIGQWHRNKTHCPQGHPYDESNTRIRPDGARACRTCAREQMRRRRAVV